MQPVAILFTAVLLAAGTAAGVTAALAPAAPPPAAPGITAAEFRDAMQRMEQKQHELELQLQQAQNGGEALQRTAVPTVSEQDVAAAVQRYLANKGLPADAVAGAEGKAKTVDAKATFAELKAKKSASYWTNPEVWKRAFDAGQMDELMAMFEAEAAANPNDPTAQMQLASAYLAYVQLDQTKGPTLGMKSDQVLDKVLELQPDHWEARFTKAVSYSFWPDFLGKKKAAMEQFDILVKQQANSPISPEQAQTYLFYGNLLDQSGQSEKAKQIWQQGLARHPDNADLQKKVGQ